MAITSAPQSGIDSVQRQMAAAAGARAAEGAAPADYFALLKPRVMSLVVFTALVGLLAAPGSIHPVLGIVALLAIAVGAGASGALNMWYDADIDRAMQRTAARPIPRGRIAPGEALGFGMVLAAFSVLVLGLAVNWVASALLTFTIAFYVLVYTMWLKRRTPQNIVIGGAAGALPPMIGWAAVTEGIALESVLLFLIIFLWTPPHFWALAHFRRRDYARVGIPMLPVTAGLAETRRQILLYTLLLVPTALAPTFIGLGGPVYGLVSAALGLVFVALAWRLFRARSDDEADRIARRLFGFSILYLFVLFAVLGGEHALARIQSLEGALT